MISGAHGTWYPLRGAWGEKRSPLFDQRTGTIHTSALRELVFYGSVQHPGLARCRRTTVDTDGQCRIELERGTDLATWTASNGAADRNAQFSEIFAPVLYLLDFLHGEHIFHGDIKPANVIITASGRGKLIDWGSSQRAPYGCPMTTYSYVSPEDALHNHWGPSNDIFAVGMTMLYYSTRKLPFHHTTKDEVAEWYRTNQSIVVPDTVPYAEVVRAMLSYDPADRPNIESILAAVDAYGTRRPKGRRTVRVASTEVPDTLRAALQSGAADARCADILSTRTLLERTGYVIWDR